jgi:hypothetical protein
MSNIEPSLQAIYTQARASHHAGPDAPKLLRQQKERVAVAMVGLLLRHDQAFRENFLTCVCDHKQMNGETWDIKLEIPNCGDLALVSRRSAFVLEFKIDSPLGDHQKVDAKDGYRDQVQLIYSSLPKRAYIVVQNEPSAESSARGTYKTWHSVREALLGVQSPWTNDLRQSLTNLNIPAFSYWRTAQLKLSQHAPAAAQVFGLLENVAKGTFGFKKTDWDVSDEDGYIGKVVLKSKDLGAAEGVIQPYSNELAWYGYEGTKLSVWFYCGPKGTASVKRKLEKMWPGAVIEEDGNVGVRINAKNITADQGFFEKTLRAVFVSKVD